MNTELEKAKEQERKELLATQNFMRTMGVDTEASAPSTESEDVDVIAMLREVSESDSQLLEQAKPPKSKALLEAEAREREELEATERFLKKAGLNVEDKHPEIEQPKPLSQEGKEMIDMLKTMNNPEKDRVATPFSQEDLETLQWAKELSEKA